VTSTAPTETQIRSVNPVVNLGFVESQLTPTVAAPKTMSVAGFTMKTMVLLAFAVAGGAWGWASATEQVPDQLGAGYGDTTVTIPGGFWLASFAAIVLAIFITVSPRRAAPLGILYAVLQGYCLGAISASFEQQTEGIVSAAVLSTFCVFVVALLLYVTGFVRPTQKLAFGVLAGVGGLCLLYLFVFVLSIFDWDWVYSENFVTIGLIVTIIAIVLAALSLVLYFGAVEAGVEAGAPKDLEWYLAFGLVVELIWLYVELVRLLALLARNR
jgi:uncharacterized YccA/Bax inhibitor family protein